jgi:hypothetical protein
LKHATRLKPKKFCGSCRWFEETRPFIGRCLKYSIMTRMENYKFACTDWAPIPGPVEGGRPVTS